MDNTLFTVICVEKHHIEMTFIEFMKVVLKFLIFVNNKIILVDYYKIVLLKYVNFASVHFRVRNIILEFSWPLTNNN